MAKQYRIQIRSNSFPNCLTCQSTRFSAHRVKRQLIHEFNTLLHIEGLPKIEDLNVLSGEFINMEYTLPNGENPELLIYKKR